MSFTETERQTLFQVARQSIQKGLEVGKPLNVDFNDYPTSLQVQRATFVTLQIQEQLRGCIGALIATQPLVIDVAEHAFSAAFRDPRFPALTKNEYPQLSVHISVLSEPQPIHFQSEADLIQQLQPGIDGLILEEGRHRGTFLPSVWKSLPEPETFLRHLKTKAGLPPDYWSNQLRISRYSTESFKE